MFGKHPSVVWATTRVSSLILAAWAVGGLSTAQSVVPGDARGTPSQVGSDAAPPPAEAVARVLGDPSLVSRGSAAPATRPAGLPDPINLQTTAELPDLPPTPPTSEDPGPLKADGIAKVGCASCGGMGQLRGTGGNELPLFKLRRFRVHPWPQEL